VSGEQTHSVKRHLDIDAQGYDVQIRRFIPYYDDMLATGVELLAALAPAGGHVLDLGGGTGALSAAVLEGRLSAYGERVAFKQGTFLDPLPRADAVVASLALHHVHDLQTKTELYRAIHDALSRGGVLLNLDAAVTQDPRLNALVFDRWAHRMSEHGITDSEARSHFAAWSDEDRYFPLEVELGALREAGFDEVECFWRRGASAITGALRAS
jgi:tRNA (cmo5U34)-methyltransferase